MQNVINMFTRVVTGAQLSAEDLLLQRVNCARKRVEVALLREFRGQRLSEAMARAERSVRAGLSSDESVRRALAWARNSIDPTPPNAPAPIAA